MKQFFNWLWSFMTKLPVNAAQDDIPELATNILGSSMLGIDGGTDRDYYSMKKYVEYIPNQSEYNIPDTTYSCGSAATSSACNILNKIEGSGIFVDYVQRWEIALNDYGAVIDKGSSMSNQIQQMLDEGLIQSYYFVNKRINDIIATLDKNIVIFTGSMKINRRKARVSPYVAEEGNGTGHFFDIVGYDNNKRHFICLNSYGENAYDKGYFYIKYEDTGLLYTMCALIDKENIKELEEKIDRLIRKHPKSKIWYEYVKRNRVDLSHGEKMSLFIDWMRKNDNL